MTNEIEIQIRVPNQTRYLSLVGKIGENLVREICRLQNNKDSFAHNLNVVLTEAMSNAIKHANTAEPDKEVQIHINVTEKELKVNVFDSGQGFDLNSVPCPSFETDCLNETGRGIFIIRSLMDSVVYRKLKCGNVLEMKKMLK